VAIKYLTNLCLSPLELEVAVLAELERAVGLVPGLAAELA